jgi:thiol-disulfide isomerase/thioredoxin
MKRSSCLLALLWPVLNSCAQTSGTKPLTIGDTIPHIILTDVVNYPVSEIRLSSQKNKLIIIDFWGRYCAPCLKALPQYDSLQQLFKDSITIITVSDFSSAKEFIAAKQKFTFLQNMHLPVLLQNNPLSPLFPYKLLSHIVWIGPGGVVKAITGAEQLTASNIRSVLNNEKLHWPVKRDMVDFDYRKPLLTIAQPVEPPAQLYYSTFTSFIEGIAPPSGTNTDDAAGISFTAFYNYNLLAMVNLALSYRRDAQRDRFTLQVKDTTPFVCNNPAQLQEWQKQNSWCYYLRLPSGISQERTRQIVQADILRWLNIMGYRVSKEIRMQANTAIETYVISDLPK